MNNEGQVFYCQCSYHHFDKRINTDIVRHTILGSITPDHLLSIKTQRGFITMEGTCFTITHECGYSMTIKIFNPSFKQEDTYAQN